MRVKMSWKKTGRYYLEIMMLSTRYFDQALDVGEKLLKNGIIRLSIEIFSKIIAYSKKSNAAKDKIIEICLANKEHQFPLQIYEQSIRENSSNYDIIYKAALIYLETGDQEKALDYFLDVDSHIRGHVDAKFRIAKIYLKMQKNIQADDYLNQVLRIDPNHQETIELRKEIW